MSPPASNGARVRDYYARLDAARAIPRELCCADMTTWMAGAGLSIAEADLYGAPFYAAFPDLTHEVIAQFEAGPDVATRLRLTGAQTAPLGAIAASGRRIEVSAIALHRFDGALIAAQWIETDRAGLLAQLGALPPGL